MFDTHCHLTFKEFAERTAELLAAAAHDGVRGAITISTTTTDCLSALNLARSHDNLWCTAGVHPLHSDEPIEWENLKRAGMDAKCVAWGELGLDNHYDRPPRDVQRKILLEQLEHLDRWRCESPILDKPIVIHCRDAFDDLLPILKEAKIDASRCVFHCFTGSPADARKVLDFGAWISFTGIVTFANAAEVAEAAKLVPPDRIMAETDAPFLTPEPFRKLRPNEPKHVVHIGRRLAALRGVEFATFEEQLDANASRFFGISMPPKRS